MGIFNVNSLHDMFHSDLIEEILKTFKQLTIIYNLYFLMYIKYLLLSINE